MGKVALITGGSRGIGASTARRLVAAGWSIALTYRSDAAAADAVVSDISNAGGAALALKGDVSSASDVSSIFDGCLARFGQLDGLVNNAGMLPPVARFEDIDLARWQRTLQVNTTGTFLCCQNAVRVMAPRYGGQGGAIVNLSSMAATLGAPGEFLDYAASKGAVESLTVGLAKELGPDGIRVNAVRPGLIETDIHGSAGDAGRVSRLAGTVPLGRSGTADETAAAVAWLLSDEASYVTGSILTVSGGR